MTTTTTTRWPSFWTPPPSMERWGTGTWPPPDQRMVTIVTIYRYYEGAAAAIETTGQNLLLSVCGASRLHPLNAHRGTMRYKRLSTGRRSCEHLNNIHVCRVFFLSNEDVKWGFPHSFSLLTLLLISWRLHLMGWTVSRQRQDFRPSTWYLRGCTTQILHRDSRMNWLDFAGQRLKVSVVVTSHQSHALECDILGTPWGEFLQM